VGTGTPYNVRPLEAEIAQQLSLELLTARIVRGDHKGRPFGTPRNPNLATLADFSPRIAEIRAGDLAATIIERKHSLYPEQEERIRKMTNDELIRFNVEDPISATECSGGLSLTGGHHRTNEVSQRACSMQMDPSTIVEVLLHD
jgi:hypothetical protein